MIVAGLSNLILLWSRDRSCWLRVGRIRINGRLLRSHKQWYWFWNHSIYWVVFLLKLSTEKLGKNISTSQSGLSLNYYWIVLAYWSFCCLFRFIWWIAVILSQTHFARQALLYIFLLITATFSRSTKAATCLCTFSLAVKVFDNPSCWQIMALDICLPYQVVKF